MTNLSPTDRDTLRAYLDALEAVPIPQITDEKLQAVAITFLVAFCKLITDITERLK